MELRQYTIEGIKALDGRRLEALGVPFGSPNAKDRQGEYFVPETELYVEVGDRRPAWYFHGLTPEGRKTDPVLIGDAIITDKTDEGWAFEVILNDTAEAQRVYEAAQKGKAAASSDAVAHLVRTDPTGRIRVWPLAGLSLLDVGGRRIPADPRATVSIPGLKALIESSGLELPEALSKVEETEDSAAAKAAETSTQEEATMDEMEVTQVEETQVNEETETPARKGGLLTPAVKRVTKLGFGEDEQERSFVRYLATGDDVPARKALALSSEGFLAPDQFFGRIVEKRDPISVVRAMGCPVYPTNKNVVDVPYEATQATAYVETAEAAAYDEETTLDIDEASVTLKKYTKSIVITEEMDADEEAGLANYLASMFARKFAMTENAVLVPILMAGSATLTLDDDVTIGPADREGGRGHHGDRLLGGAGMPRRARRRGEPGFPRPAGDPLLPGDRDVVPDGAPGHHRRGGACAGRRGAGRG